MTDKKTIETN